MIKERNTRHLWLVRHGLTRWNAQQRLCGHSDIPLSAPGQAQARWLAHRLEGETISTIYTSDLKRARETAEIIARSRAQPVQINISAAWREIDFGAWEGLTYTEIAAQSKDQPAFFTDPAHRSPPGGESLTQVLHRVQAALITIVSADDLPMKGDIMIVSHAGPLRALLCSMLGMPLERQWQLRLDPGSLSAIDLLLPIQEPSAPLGTLALLNVQRPRHTRRPALYSRQQSSAEVSFAADSTRQGALIDDAW